MTTPAQQALIASMTSPLQFWFFKWRRLPSLRFWGVRLQQLDTQSCAIAISYKRSTQNPFRSIYFAALAGAGELSTGALILVHTSGAVPVSMLVTHCEMNFTKKGLGTVVFTCADGQRIEQAIAGLAAEGDTAQIVLTCSGIDEAGDEVCNMAIQWSLKRR